jgi:regulator of protease activity HflC (stomatin/prohibitin superfamily)
MPDPLVIVAIAVAIIALALVVRAVFDRVTVYEFEVGLRYHDGRFTGVVQPGAYWVWTPSTSIRRVDTRTLFRSVQGQELVTSDGISVKISLALIQRVVDPALAVHGVEDYVAATYTIAQVALREVVAGLTVDELLARRSEVGAEVLGKTSESVRALGVELDAVSVKDLMLPAATKRILNQVVEARQRGLATLEKARGETAALRALANAARMVESNPALLQLRLLQQLESTSGNTVLVGMPPSTTPVPVRQVGRPTPEPDQPEPPPSQEA